MNSQNVVSVSLWPHETDLIRAAAEREHSTVTEYMRGAAGRAAILAQPGARLVHLPNGAPLALWTNVPREVRSPDGAQLPA